MTVMSKHRPVRACKGDEQVGKTFFGSKSSKLCKLGVFWNPQDLLFMMGTEIFKIDAAWAEKLTKTRVSFLMTPTVLTSKYYQI